MSILFWCIVLVLLGFGLIVLEFLLPSGGILGALATASLLAAILLGFWTDVRLGAGIFIAVACLLPVFFYAAMRIWPSTPLGRAIINDPSDHQSEELDEVSALKALIGAVGLARNPMTPSGAVRLRGKNYDAVSNGGFVDAGQAVKVVGIEMKRLVVRLTREKPDVAAAKVEVEDTTEASLNESLESLGIEPLDDPLS
jgi:membrane-bound serine protease (ClpP class)